jgi:hypothetical protein
MLTSFNAARVRTIRAQVLKETNVTIFQRIVQISRECMMMEETNVVIF